MGVACECIRPFTDFECLSGECEKFSFCYGRSM